MLRRLNIPLLVIGSGLGLWLLGNSSLSWGQTCPVTHGCSTAIVSGADYASIGGGWVNLIGSGGDYATVGGGRQNSATAFAATVGGGRENSATVSFASVGGGYSNAATAYTATVCGGNNNEASRESATVGGGAANVAGALSATVGGGAVNAANKDYATVAGGRQNNADATYATVGGGGQNDATGERSVVSGGYLNLASGPRAAVNGGYLNTASGFGAMVPGGAANAALGSYSWAGGLRAKAWQKGAFVWADATGANFPSTAANQFNVRASGGTRIFSNSAATTGVRLLPGSNAWSIVSDRAVKEDFQPVDKQQILANVQQLKIQNWKLKDEAGNVRHIGPVAQEFHAAFGLGSDERSIHTGDAHGVALVAIQALTERVDILQQENAELRQQLSQVMHMVHTLEQKRQSNLKQRVALTE